MSRQKFKNIRFLAGGSIALVLFTIVNLDEVWKKKWESRKVSARAYMKYVRVETLETMK